MLNTAALHMRVQGRSTTLTPIDGSPWRTVRLKISDADAMVRLAPGMDMSDADAVAFAAESDGPFVQGDTLTQGGTTYRVDAVLEGRSPGMVRMDLSRLSGPGVVRQDLGRALSVMPTEPVQVNGRTVRAHVNRQGIFWEDQGLGVPVETVRIILTMRAADAVGIGAGDTLTMGGQEYLVRDALRTAAGTVRVVL